MTRGMVSDTRNVTTHQVVITMDTVLAMVTGHRPLTVVIADPRARAILTTRLPYPTNHGARAAVAGTSDTCPTEV